MPEQLPIKDNSVDLVVLNLYPVWLTDPNPLFAEINRVLTTQGLVLFTSLGPDTLNQLADCWQQVDGDYTHIMPFADMHDIGDGLTRNGFHNIVMENEPLNIGYSDIDSIHNDLRLTSHASLATDRRRTLLGKQRYDNYMSLLKSKIDPQLNITYDVIFGHGWKGYKQPKHAVNAHPEQFDSIPIKSLD